MSRTVFVVTDSGAQAQYSQEQVEAMLKAGQLAPNQHYWTEGMSDWRPLSEFLQTPPEFVISSVPPAPGEVTGFRGYAGFWRRAVAALLDGIVVYIASFIVGFAAGLVLDRKSTRLNSSHVAISYAVFCLKKKT